MVAWVEGCFGNPLVGAWIMCRNESPKAKPTERRMVILLTKEQEKEEMIGRIVLIDRGVRNEGWERHELGGRREGEQES